MARKGSTAPLHNALAPALQRAMRRRRNRDRFGPADPRPLRALTVMVRSRTGSEGEPQPWLSLHASADATVVMAATTLSTAVPHGPYWAQRHRQAAGRHLDCRNCRTYGHARDGTSAARSSARGRIRTCGLLLRRQTLYPLSYAGGVAQARPGQRWSMVAEGRKAPRQNGSTDGPVPFLSRRSRSPKAEALANPPPRRTNSSLTSGGAKLESGQPDRRRRPALVSSDTGSDASAAFVGHVGLQRL